MRKKILNIVLVLMFLSFWACSSDSPTAPTPDPVILDCELNHTGEVVFENRSLSGTTFDVIWNGEIRATLAPGEKSETYTEFIGGGYKLKFVISGTLQETCPSISPWIVECVLHEYGCSF